MREVEVKILDIDVEKIRNKLQELGAKKIFAGDLQVLNFDTPDKRLKSTGGSFRLRKVGDQVEMCFKDKKQESHCKVREETQVLTNDFDRTRQLIEKLGFIQTYTGGKYRESYLLGESRIEIDQYPDIPAFIEVEASDESAVEKHVNLLGYTMDQTTNLSASQLKERYQ